MYGSQSFSVGFCIYFTYLYIIYIFLCLFAAVSDLNLVCLFVYIFVPICPERGK